MIRRSIELPVIAAVVLAAACARPVPAAPEPMSDAGVVLDDAAVTSLAELLRMEDARAFDAALVTRLLRDTVAEVRARAALAAGRIRDAAAKPLLLHAIRDPDAGVRARAAFALGELADSSTEVIAALGTAALRDEVGAALEAAAALGRIGSARGRAALDSILTAGTPAEPLLHEALLVAWRLPNDRGTIDGVARWTASENGETRWRAAYALARGGGRSTPEHLLPLVADVDARVRASAVRGLRAGLADSAGVRMRALAALMNAARDTHPHVRINALSLLAAYHENARTTPVLAAALQDADPNVAIAAASGLAQAADAAAAAALRAATVPGRPDGLRIAALHAWSRADSAAAADVAIQWTDSSRWILRLHAARALARARNARSATALRQLGRDTHPLVAAEALSAMRAAELAGDMRTIFLERMAAAHPLVRAAAIRGFAATAGAGDLDVLFQAWDRARQDTIRDAALAVINALARLRRAGTPVERAFFLRFGARGAPSDPVVYRAIGDSIGRPPASWTEPPARAPVRPLPFYVDIVRAWVAPVLAGAAPPQAVIATPYGDIVLDLAAADAPLTVHNFTSLIESGYYGGTRWHRVVPNFVIQDGDPRGDGSGGPGYAIRDEINPLRYQRGTLGMALSGPDTGGSQFFITLSPQPHLDGGYTVFGRVSSGMDVVDRIVQEDPVLGMRVVGSPGSGF
ncbi:MAG TPA: peptidylprolyl isomerase [Longimicrobiales bacterium]